jgi:hypothetical protein
MHYDAHQLRALAVAAVCDPRTASRWLKGETVLGTTRVRLEAAAATLRIGLPAPAMAIASGLPLVAAHAAGQLR